VKYVHLLTSLVAGDWFHAPEQHGGDIAARARGGSAGFALGRCLRA